MPLIPDPSTGSNPRDRINSGTAEKFHNTKHFVARGCYPIYNPQVEGPLNVGSSRLFIGYAPSYSPHLNALAIRNPRTRHDLVDKDIS
jgi:hypothetical protein